MEGENACSVCNQAPARVCACSHAWFCDKHMAKHLKTEGEHSVASPESVKVAISSRSSSLKETKTANGELRRRSSSAKDRKKTKKAQISEESGKTTERRTLTKVDYIALLQNELAKVAKYRESITDAVATMAESLISHIITESKSISREITHICSEFEAPLQAALTVLEGLPDNEQSIPRSNKVLSRLYDAREQPGYEMVKLTANLHEVQLNFRSVAEYTASWTPVAAMVQLEQYYTAHRAEMHENVRNLYETILAEEHYTVEVVAVSKSGLGERGGAEHLAQVLKYFMGVKEVKMGGNDLTGEDCRVLLPEIRGMKGVTKLHLQKNDLKASGGRELSFILGDLTKLRDLDLSGNSLGAEGMRHIAGVLKKLPSLKFLHLQDNLLGSESAKTLAAALKQVKTLKGLHLEGNSFSSEDMRMLNNSNASGCKIFFNKSS